MTAEEVLGFLNNKVAAIDAIWAEIQSIDITTANRLALEAKFAQLNAVIDEGKAVYDANMSIAYKHGFCVIRNKYYFRINKIQKQLNALEA